jgi:hypothetical protein
MLPAVRRQARACADLGSPMYADLLTRLAADLEHDGVFSRVLAGHEHDPGPSALALRLLGSVHRLVLEGRAPELARFYPSVGGSWSPGAGWSAFARYAADSPETIRAHLDQAPQTNEVGRAAALLGGLRHVAAEHRLPVRLREIGASGGLNLRADRYCYLDEDGREHGDVDSPVRLAGAWRGRTPPEADVRVTDRLGSDIAPVDPATEEGRLTLLSYVWPDQVARCARLRDALDVAAAVPAQVRQQGAREFVDGLDLVEGATTVLWHSVMWQYLDRDDQQAVRTRIEALGAQATAGCGFAHLLLEPSRPGSQDEHEFLVVLRTWPGGEHRVLGVAAPHGLPATWR